MDRQQLRVELAKRRKQLALTRLRTVYYHDPVLFARECFEWLPNKCLAFYQEDILFRLIDNERVSVRSPRGAGKTTTAAIAILWFALTRDAMGQEDGQDWKIPTTAGSHQQLQKFLWPEVHKWAQRLRWEWIGRDKPFDSRTELQHNTLRLNKRGMAFTVASDVPELMEGVHADRLLFVFDESKSIPVKTWDSLEGSFSGTGENRALAISTPGEPLGRFYQIQTKQPGFDGDEWYVRPITLEDTIKAGRVRKAWADQMLKAWGETSSDYMNHVLGEFATADESAVIKFDHLEICHQNWVEWKNEMKESGTPELKDLTAIGIDLARTGPDKNAFAYRKDYVIVDVETDSEKDTMVTADNGFDLLKLYGGIGVVDTAGVGGGPFDQMRKLGAEVVPFHAQKRTLARDRSGELSFKDLRAAAWWRLRELIDPLSGLKVCIPPDDELTSDLISVRRKRADASVAINVEEKGESKKRLGRSPDKGDAVVMAFALELMSGYEDIEVWGGNPDPETAEREERELQEWLEKEDDAELRNMVIAEGGIFPSDDWG